MSLHATQLLKSQPLTASADLSINTLSHFLDRFVYKNPKKLKESGEMRTKGASAMQPAASSNDATGVKLIRGEAAGGSAPVNMEKFWKRRAEDVPVDEVYMCLSVVQTICLLWLQVFFHRFFTQKHLREKSKAAKSGLREDGSTSEDLDGDIASADSDSELDETVVWKVRLLSFLFSSYLMSCPAGHESNFTKRRR